MSRRILLSVVVVCVLLVAKAAVAVGAEELSQPKPARERLEAARNAYNESWQRFKPFTLAKGDGENVYRWSRRWMEAERDVATTRAERVAAVERHLERMKELEQEVHNYGRIHSTIPILEMAATTFYRAEAKTWLAEESAR
jgi:hypothetical protein